MVTRECKQCGKEFKTYNSQIKRGGGKFCSKSCRMTYNNLRDNPSKRPEVRDKISKNHADVSGENNPMYRKRGIDSPNYIDGRTKYNSYYRFVALSNKPHVCEICGIVTGIENLHVHHLDKDRNNNKLNNLQVLCPKCHLGDAHKGEIGGHNTRLKLKESDIKQIKKLRSEGFTVEETAKITGFHAWTVNKYSKKTQNS